MKKFLTFTLIVISTIIASLCFVACNKDGEEKDTALMAEVAGTYYLSYYYEDFGGLYEDDEPLEMSFTPENTYGTYTLNADGSGTLSAYAQVNITWSASGNTLKIYAQSESGGTFTIGENELILEQSLEMSQGGVVYTIFRRQILTKIVAE